MSWLIAYSCRPKHAAALLAKCCRYADGPGNPSNQVMASRMGLARELGIPASDVSRIMSELFAIHALHRKRIDGHNHYYVSHWLGHNLTQADLIKALEATPKLKLDPPRVAAEAPEPVAA